MIVFWIIAAGMVLTALAFVLPPLLKKAQSTGPARDALNIVIYKQRLAELEADLQNDNLNREQFEQARIELERELLQDVPESENKPDSTRSFRSRWPVVVLSVVVPILAIGLYLQLGNTDALTQDPGAHPAPATESTVPSIETMVSRLATRLQDDPDDGKGWSMLGRSYVIMKRYNEAGLAYARAHELLGDQPDLLVEYAEVLAVINDNQLTGKPAGLLKKVLKAQPRHPKALWLAGHAAMQKGNKKQAVKYWERLLQILPPESKDARTVQQYITQAKGS